MEFDTAVRHNLNSGQHDHVGNDAVLKASTVQIQLGLYDIAPWATDLLLHHATTCMAQGWADSSASWSEKPSMRLSLKPGHRASLRRQQGLVHLVRKRDGA